ncbi:MAG: hypothetical protein JWN04_5401 [Myxococcaceae bacterium]|nr:hypothetical protein [Myxococcaceae bacterium]
MPQNQKQPPDGEDQLRAMYAALRGATSGRARRRDLVAPIARRLRTEAKKPGADDAALMDQTGTRASG